MKQYHKYRIKQNENDNPAIFWLTDEEATEQRTRYRRFVENVTVSLDVTLIINKILNEYDHLHDTQNVHAADDFIEELKAELKHTFTTFQE